jgi:hypothetical protein
MIVGSNHILTERVSPAPREVWRYLLHRDDGARASLTPEWLDAACAATGGSDASRLYRWSDGRELVLPLVKSRSRLASMPRAWGIGGLVSAGPPRTHEVRALFDDLESQRFSRVSLRPGPDHAAVWEAAAPERAIRVRHQTHEIDLSEGFETIWNERFSRSNRRNVRKVRTQGLSVEVASTASSIDVFYDLYLRWTDVRAQRRRLPPGFARYLARRREPRAKFDEVVDRLGESARVWVARDDGEPVAAAIELVFGTRAVAWRAASVRPTPASKYANVLLNTLMIERACAEGCVSYDMGESGGVASLMEYKQRFGAEPVTYNEYRLERLPFTALELRMASVLGLVERGLSRPLSHSSS